MADKLQVGEFTTVDHDDATTLVSTNTRLVDVAELLDDIRKLRDMADGDDHFNACELADVIIGEVIALAGIEPDDLPEDPDY